MDQKFQGLEVDSLKAKQTKVITLIDKKEAVLNPTISLSNYGINYILSNSCCIQVAKTNRYQSLFIGCCIRGDI